MTAIVIALTDPGLWIALAVFTLVRGVLVRLTPVREPDWLDIKIEKCRAETGHRIDRKPQGPLSSTELFPRFPGLYSEQACRCGRKTKIRWIAFEGSKAAQDFRRNGG